MEDRVLIVIPAYNEETSIDEVIAGLHESVPEFDRVVINDGSSDRTEAILDELGEKQLRLVCNLGYGWALQTGLKYGLIHNYDIIVSMDADGQHRPQDVRQLVKVLREQKADMVIGSRFCDGASYKTPINRRMGQLLFSHMTRLLLGHRIYDTSSGFKALRSRACEVIVERAFMDFHIETVVQLSLFGFKIVEHPIEIKERVAGVSMHSISSIFHYPIRTILLTLSAILDAKIIRRSQ
jgi:glycosyltransferase involved in cell wall biosynthesis